MLSTSLRGPLRALLLAACLATCVGAPGLATAAPAPLRGIALIDHRGQPVSVTSLAGRPLLLHFVFTGCSSTCPTQVRDLAVMLDGLPSAIRRQLRVLSVSVDPRSDTPATLADYARRLDADRPGWRFATGSMAHVESLVDRMAAAGPTRRAEDHRTSLWLYDAGGQLVQRYAGVPVDRARLQREITQLLDITRNPQR